MSSLANGWIDHFTILFAYRNATLGIKYFQCNFTKRLFMLSTWPIIHLISCFELSIRYATLYLFYIIQSKWNAWPQITYIIFQGQPPNVSHSDIVSYHIQHPGWIRFTILFSGRLMMQDSSKSMEPPTSYGHLKETVMTTFLLCLDFFFFFIWSIFSYFIGYLCALKSISEKSCLLFKNYIFI